MLIEALIPMNLTLPEGVKTLNVGDRVDLPEMKARKLLRLAKGKVQMVNESDHLSPDVANLVEPSNARLAFDLNSNLPDQREVVGNQAIFFPSGRKIRYQSPMWGELEAEVLDDHGAVVWCWHPIRYCECCIPREWILGLVD